METKDITIQPFLFWINDTVNQILYIYLMLEYCIEGSVYIEGTGRMSEIIPSGLAGSWSITSLSHFTHAQSSYIFPILPTNPCGCLYRYNSLVSPLIVVVGNSCGITPITSVLGECVNQPTYTT